METIRPAGLNERRCISRDALGYYGSVVVLCDYVSSTEQLPMSDIVKALKQCVTQHPVLCTVIKDSETEKPLLAKASHMNLDNHLRILDPARAGRTEAESLQGLLEVIQNEPLPNFDTQPSWRLYIVPVSSANSALAPQAFCAAFAYSHALADGTSGVLFHRTFLRALRDAQESSFDSKREWDVPSTEQPLGAMEHIAKLTISWSFLLRPLLAEFLPSMLANALGVNANKPSNLWTGASVRPPKPAPPPQLLQTAVRVKRVPKATVQTVLTTCRTHNVRLTGLLLYLTSRALSQALHARGLYSDSFTSQTSIDLRRLVPVAESSMGNFPSTVSADITISSSAQSGHSPDEVQKLTDEEWATVQRLSNRTSQASSSLADQQVALLKYLTNIRDWTIKESNKPSDTSFEVSNLGVFSDPDAGTDTAAKWIVTDMAFSQSASALGPPLTLNVASAKQGSLALVITWWPGMLGVDDEENFVEEVCAGLEAELDSVG